MSGCMKFQVTRRRLRRVLAASLLIAVSGCASKSDNIDAIQVSPLKFEPYNCDQLGQEYARLLQVSQTTNRKQDDIATNDSVAMGVGLVLFWPALFFIDTNDQREQVAQLKGELTALEQVSIKKSCTNLSTMIVTDRAAAIQAAEEKKKRDQEATDD